MVNNITEQFKSTFRNTVQNVAVVTANGLDGNLHGVTIGSATSFSINPPAISFSLNAQSQTHHAIKNSQYFALNNLNDSQQKIAEQFAANIDNRFKEINLLDNETRAPIIQESLSALILRLGELYEYKEHVIIIGIVEKVFTADELSCNSGKPLTYYLGQYNNL